MKRKTIALGTGILIAALMGAGALLAQKAQSPAGKETGISAGGSSARHPHRTIYLRGGDEGAWLGVEIADVSSEKARELKLPGEYGAIVEDVREDSPAAKAGLKKGDVIFQFAGEKVRSVAELRRLVRETPAGRTVALEISRDGHTQSLTAKLEAPPEAGPLYGWEGPSFEMPQIHIPDLDFNVMFAGAPRLGISADDLTPQLASYFGVKQGKGVLVREVEDGTPAQKAGLKAGDVIVRAGGTEVDSVADLRRALRQAPEEKRQISLTIVRDRKEMTLTVELEPPTPLLGPRRVADLRDVGISPEEMDRVKAEVQAHSAEIEKGAEELRLQGEKIREEVQRAMKEHQGEMERLQRELEKLRLEQIQEPI
jgi:serine protease Do